MFLNVLFVHLPACVDVYSVFDLIPQVVGQDCVSAHTILLRLQHTATHTDVCKDPAARGGAMRPDTPSDGGNTHGRMKFRCT